MAVFRFEFIAWNKAMEGDIYERGRKRERRERDDIKGEGGADHNLQSKHGQTRRGRCHRSTASKKKRKMNKKKNESASVPESFDNSFSGPCLAGRTDMMRDLKVSTRPDSPSSWRTIAGAAELFSLL